MNRFGGLLIIAHLAFAAQTLRADDWAGKDFDTLLYHAQRYGDTPERREHKALARAELFSRGAESLRFLMEHIHIENIWIRLMAQELTFELSTPDAVGVLRDFVDADEQRTRRFALFLMSVKEPDASLEGHAELVRRVRARVSDEEAGGASLRLLGKWGVHEALDDMVAATDHPEERRRITAVNALRDLGDPAAAPALIARLDDEFFTVRYPAARALAAFGDAAHALMEEALNDATDRQARHLRHLLDPDD